MTTNPTGNNGLQGFVNTAQGLIGGHSTQPTQGAGLNKAIDTAQGYLGHVGQGGTGVHGAIDNFQQSALGNNAISSAMYGGAGYLAGQGAGAGNQGLLNTAQGLISGGNAGGFSAQPHAPISLASKTVDTVQGLMGHHGQGGTGIHGAIDKAQGYFDHSAQQGVAPTQAQGGNGLLNTAQNLLGNGHAGQPMTNNTQTGGINSTIDSVQGMMGHHGQGGTGIHGAIDKAQGFIGLNGQQQAVNRTQPVMGNQQGGLLNTAQNLIGGGRTAQPGVANTTNQAGGINRAIDTAQGFMGHHGQGGTGIHGAIDRAQGFVGHTDQAGLH